MIPSSPLRLQSASWQQEMADAITDPRELLAILELSTDAVSHVDFDPDERFAMRVTRYFAGLMRPGDANDPLLAQVLPTRHERQDVAGYVTDPVGDLAAARDAGILHKYQGRALAVTTGACAIHCRYCFRRHFPYTQHSSLRQWQRALDTLRDQPDISELILSGGDPLSLSDRRLATMLERAAEIPHLTRLRLHTRLPVVLPTRVSDELCALLASTRLQGVLVLHVNHANEITAELASALEKLRKAGMCLLNQAVLLKSVNDNADTQVTLCESLFAVGVTPYYLHLLDRVAGAAHFDVPLEDAQALYSALHRRLPGYLVPRMVREQAGAPGKTPVALA